jgi:amylosucrase
VFSTLKVMPAMTDQTTDTDRWTRRVQAACSPALALRILERSKRHRHGLDTALAALYPPRAAHVADRLLDCALEAIAQRSTDLHERDRTREADPLWFQAESMIGYVCYTDLFAGTLHGVTDHLDHLNELGVTYLHLMPLLKARDGENDGGYAVVDYHAVDPRLGTMDELEALAGQLHERDISLCVDLVVNHTAAEHVWAQRALRGEKRYRDYYLVFDDRTMPDAYEASLPLVFPTFKMTNFTWVEDLGWVWTTFNEFQWDLNYANPDVLVEMTSIVLALANRGIDILRLDAIPFTWKRLGTNCQNQPEAHLLGRVLRALVGIAAPSTLLKAEAIVPPNELVGYLGAPTHAGEPAHFECDIAYNNQAMVMLWSSLASCDGRLISQSLKRLPTAPEHTTWVTYARCHDDIGWAIDDVDANAVGWGGGEHRKFLSDFFAGDFPGSYARGARFQVNPLTGDARTSGTAAALTGIQDALQRKDPVALALAERRYAMVYSSIFAIGGIPLIYMGDEFGLLNDMSFVDDPTRADDNRWMHRPTMPWTVADHRYDVTTVPGRLFTSMQSFSKVRASLPSLQGGGVTEPLLGLPGSVMALRRQHGTSSPVLVLANWSPDPVSLPLWPLDYCGLDERRVALGSDTLDLGHAPDTSSTNVIAPPTSVMLPGLSWFWLV